MAGVALILTSARTAAKTIQAAIRKAREAGGPVRALLVMDTGAPPALWKSMQELGFIEDLRNPRLEEAVAEEYRDQLWRTFENIRDEGARAGLDMESEYVEGSFVPVASERIRRWRPAVVLVSRLDRSHLSRFLHGGKVEELRGQISVPMEVVDEGEPAPV
ncbi:MAG: hypothetical protein GMKNLPBB_03407 [Myxococcota bacterium]|nr:hypothetical protein [Myxococcota bacterium]